MTARSLLRLYPRAWRERYGDEFLEVVGPEPVTLQQAIDIVSGAIDARLSTDVDTATRITTAGGGSMVRTMVCRKPVTRYTRRDAMIGAAVMIVASIACAVSGTVLSRNGWTELGEAVLNTGFITAFTLSMPFWLTKGQPWKAQAVVGGTLALLIAITALATLI